MTGNTSQNNALEGRDAKTGRFIAGNNGGGRKLGSRNKLTTEFLDDLYAKWQKHGPDVLERVIRDDPAAFLRTVAQTLPWQWASSRFSSPMLARTHGHFGCANIINAKPVPGRTMCVCPGHCVGTLPPDPGVFS